MSMRKKDYEAIARAINPEYPDDGEYAGTEARAMMISQRIADYCATQDVNFKRERFLKACGVQS